MKNAIGNDNLFGHGDSDIILDVEGGNDRLDGGAGQDICFNLGSSNDLFVNGLKLICLKIKCLYVFTFRPNFVFLSQSCSRISKRAFALKLHGLYIRKNTKIHRC
jgi:hypothetical protein